MAKKNALGAQLYIGTGDLSNDVGSVQTIATPRGSHDVTGLDKSAYERVLGLSEGMMGFSPHFNPAAGQAHAVLGALPTTDFATMFTMGSTIGDAAAGMWGPQINYDGTRSADGGMTFATSNVGDGYSLEWGQLLTAGKATSTGAENLASLDNGASTADGLAAYLCVFAFTGTSATITIQESSDDGSGDAFAAVTGGAFTAVTAATSERIVTADPLTVEQYLRIAITGTYSNLEFAVMVKRRDANEIL